MDKFINRGEYIHKESIKVKRNLNVNEDVITNGIRLYLVEFINLVSVDYDFSSIISHNSFSGSLKKYVIKRHRSLETLLPIYIGISSDTISNRKGRELMTLMLIEITRRKNRLYTKYEDKLGHFDYLENDILQPLEVYFEILNSMDIRTSIYNDILYKYGESIKAARGAFITMNTPQNRMIYNYIHNVRRNDPNST